jgi:hypothetical protein
VSAFISGRFGGQCLPGSGTVVRDQARAGCRHALGKRRFPYEGADKFAARASKHQLQFAMPRM